MRLVDVLRELLIVCAEGSHEVPEVVATPVSLWGNSCQKCTIDTLGAIPLRRTGSGDGHTYIANHCRGCLEIDDLPPVHTLTRPVELLGPEGRRLDIGHPAGYGRRALRMGNIEGCAGDRLVADAARVDVGLVRQVHQVVDHEAVVACQSVEGAAFAIPVGAVVPMEVGNLVWICKRGITGPDPYEAMALDYRIGTHAG